MAGTANGKDILDRSVAYALRVIDLGQSLERRGAAGRVLGNQLLRSGTSIGANLHEAQAAQSRADFIAKMSISHKEARESAYWLRLIQGAGIAPEAKVSELADETDQLIRILGSILLTSKRNGSTRNS